MKASPILSLEREPPLPPLLEEDRVIAVLRRLLLLLLLLPLLVPLLVVAFAIRLLLMNLERSTRGRMRVSGRGFNDCDEFASDWGRAIIRGAALGSYAPI